MADLDFSIERASGGEISSSLFRDAISRAVGLLREFDSVISGKARGSLLWNVTKLHSNGNLGVVFSSKVKGRSRLRHPLEDFSPAVTSSLMVGIDDLERRAVTPANLTEHGIVQAGELSGMIAPTGASGFKFKHLDQVVQITNQTQKNATKLLKIERTAIGSVEGTLEGINLHRKARVVVYRSLTKRPVTCEFDDERFIEAVKSALGKRVVVFGTLRKNVNGDTLRIRMERIKVLGDPALQDRWSADISGLADPDFAGTPSTEEYLRIIRG